jgi:predicted GNAT family acetyltransferase
MRYRHQGIGDKLVKQCLDWAKESGTLVIPTCHFVQRHLEYVGHHKYDSIIVKTEQEASTFPLDIQSINCSNKQE